MTIMVVTCLTGILACSDEKPPANGNNGVDPSLGLDAGAAEAEDAAGSASTLPTVIAPVAGGGEASSEKYRGRISITAPQPLGQTSSDKHKATLSVTGAQP